MDVMHGRLPRALRPAGPGTGMGNRETREPARPTCAAALNPRAGNLARRLLISRSPAHRPRAAGQILKRSGVGCTLPAYEYIRTGRGHQHQRGGSRALV